MTATSLMQSMVRTACGRQHDVILYIHVHVNQVLWVVKKNSEHCVIASVMHHVLCNLRLVVNYMYALAAKENLSLVCLSLPYNSMQFDGLHKSTHLINNFCPTIPSQLRWILQSEREVTCTYVHVILYTCTYVHVILLGNREDLGLNIVPECAQTT